MTFIAVQCPHCLGEQIVKRGKTHRGTQRYPDARYRHWLVCQPLCLWTGGVKWLSPLLQHYPRRKRSQQNLRVMVHFPITLAQFAGFVDRAYGRNAPERFTAFPLAPHRWLLLTVTGDRAEPEDRVVQVRFDAVTVTLDTRSVHGDPTAVRGVGDALPSEAQQDPQESCGRADTAAAAVACPPTPLGWTSRRTAARRSQLQQRRLRWLAPITGAIPAAVGGPVCTAPGLCDATG